jgi:hypothetical protein
MGRGAIRNGALLESGTLSPNPWDFTLSGQNPGLTLKEPERRIGLRRDATRAPFPAPELLAGGSKEPLKTLAIYVKEKYFTQNC